MTSPPVPVHSDRLVEALQHAARWHQTQVRKGTTIPYISHPLRVCALVLDDGGSEDEACAALLHDSVEDTSATLEDVTRLFGPDVARIVELCSDDDGDAEMKPPWFARKAAHFQHLRDDPGFDTMAARVMAADKLANLTAQLDDHEALGIASWDRFKGGIAGTLWYLETATTWVAPLLEGGSRLPTHLMAGLERLRAIRDEEQASLGGLDGRVADVLSTADAPPLPGWAPVPIQLAAFEIARTVYAGAAPRTATLTVLANWFGTPMTKRAGADEERAEVAAIDRLAASVASRLSASS